MSLLCFAGSQRGYWSTEVNGIALWAPLQPRPVEDKLDGFMDSELPEVICYETAWLRNDQIGQACGRDGKKSKYDLNVALTAAATALAMAVEEVQLRRTFPTERWYMFFKSQGKLWEWKREKAHVQVLTPYRAMVQMVLAAVEFFNTDVTVSRADVVYSCGLHYS